MKISLIVAVMTCAITASAFASALDGKWLRDGENCKKFSHETTYRFETNFSSATGVILHEEYTFLSKALCEQTVWLDNNFNKVRYTESNSSTIPGAIEVDLIRGLSITEKCLAKVEQISGEEWLTYECRRAEDGRPEDFTDEALRFKKVQ